MSEAGLQAVLENTASSNSSRVPPDPPEALAKIPSLELADLEKRNKLIPLAVTGLGDTPVLYHDLETNGIVYLDVALTCTACPRSYYPM